MGQAQLKPLIRSLLWGALLPLLPLKSQAEAAPVILVLGEVDPEAELVKVFSTTIQPYPVIIFSMNHLPPVLPTHHLILAIGDPAARWAVDHSRVPWVHLQVAQPENLKASPQPPMVAVSPVPAPLEQLSMIKALLGEGTVCGLAGPRGHASVGQYENAARATNLQWRLMRLDGPESLGLLGQQVGRCQAFLALPDPELWTPVRARLVVALSLRTKIPFFGYSKGFAKIGALAALAGDDPPTQGQLAGQLAHNLLTHRTSPAVTWPPGKLIINLVVARRLGLEPSASLIRDAEVLR